jgi:phosphoribosylanthranilate isomerase
MVAYAFLLPGFTFMRCRVKVCGITSSADAQMVGAAGVDAIGLVFYAKSKRNLSIAQAVEICHAIPPFVTIVGLFLDAEADFVREVLAAVPLDILQFHGSETPDYCAQFSRPYMKAVGMKGLVECGGFAAYADRYPAAQGFLVDSHAPGAAGGTGEVFDWTQVPQDYLKPIILAGGLQAENVAEAIRTSRVYAVDVSSGVESAPGVKDAAKVQAFMTGVRLANYLAIHPAITEAEVLQAQQAWGEGLVAIGKLTAQPMAAKAAAERLVQRLYNYAEGKVLFKPTKAAHDQFRETFEQAISYFVGGDHHEDHGFALHPWAAVRFENNSIFLDVDSAGAMGNYYFSDAKTGKETKVEYTFAYRRAGDGRLVIFLHHSSLPYQAAH